VLEEKLKKNNVLDERCEITMQRRSVLLFIFVFLAANELGLFCEVNCNLARPGASQTSTSPSGEISHCGLRASSSDPQQLATMGKHACGDHDGHASITSARPAAKFHFTTNWFVAPAAGPSENSAYPTDEIVSGADWLPPDLTQPRIIVLRL